MWATGIRARVSAATRTVWQKKENPIHLLSRGFNGMTLVVIYLVAGFVIGALAYHFQHEGFTPPTIPGQVYVSVFEQNPAAELQLAASINAKDPGVDTVTVTDLKGNPGRWLLIIECPSQVSETAGSAPATNAAMYTETPLQIQLVPAAPSPADKPSQVIEKLGKPFRPRGESHTFGLGCFTSQTGSYSIGNVALPALGTDQAITTEPGDIQGLPELYAEKNVLVESIGNPLCPGSTASTGAGPSPDTGSSGTAPVSSSASPSGTASAATIVGPDATATPSPSVPPSGNVNPSGSDTPSGSESPSATAPSGPQSPACFFQSPPTVPPVDYFLPRTLTTEETVTQVNLSGGWVLQSQFPTGTTDNNTITWEGAAGLSPDIHADNPSADSNSNHATFLSGILWGVVGGAGVSLVDHLERVNSERRERKDEQTKESESGAHSVIPTAGDEKADHG